MRWGFNDDTSRNNSEFYGGVGTSLIEGWGIKGGGEDAGKVSEVKRDRKRGKKDIRCD